MCDFCREFREEEDDEGRMIWRDNEFVVLPTRGAFVEGYCLMLPIDHTMSFAQLDRAQLATVEARIEFVRSAIEERYGPVLVAEHGADVCGVGSNCCDHAHLHFVPVSNIDSVERAYRARGGMPIEMRSAADLADFERVSYMYLSPAAGRHLVWTGVQFPRQFVRRVCATMAGVPDMYDWRTHPFVSAMQATQATLRVLNWTAMSGC